MKKFAFLIHPREVFDVTRRFRATKFLPNKLVEGTMKNLRGRLGFTVCSTFRIKSLGKEIKGYLIAILLSGQQIKTLPREVVHKRILSAVLFAQKKLGADVIGLGALTSSVTKGGQWIVDQPQVKAVITHGDSYAVAVAKQGIEKIVRIKKNNPMGIKIAIVGAHGLIGEALTRLLARKGYALVLIGKEKKRLEELKQKIKIFRSDAIFTSLNLEKIYEADIIITVTSHPGALIKSKNLKKGAVIYDVAQPMNVSSSLVKKRSDIIKIDGAYVNIDGINLGFNMGPPKETTFACFVETIMMALEDDKSHHTGTINMDFVKKTEEWAKKYGFSHAPFTCFGASVPSKKLEKALNYKN